MSRPVPARPAVPGSPKAVRGTVTWSVAAAWTAIAAGILMRLAHLIGNRNLWTDELLLANDVLPRALPELMQPLKLTGAPVGFLVLTRLAAAFLGPHDWVLRLVPFAAGCAALLLLYRVALRVLTPVGATVAVTALAVAEPAIYYASEFKQYSSDLAVSTAILLAGLRAHELSSTSRLVTLGLVALAAISLSYPAVFVLTAAGVVLFGVELHAGRRRSAVALAAVGAIGAAAFVASYVLFLRPLVANEHMQQVWTAGFMPLSPVAAVQWQAVTLYDALEDPIGVSIAGVGAVTAVLGAVVVARRRPAALALLLLPVAFAMGASTLHLFPFVGRHTFFVAPSFVLLIAAGIESLVRETRFVPRLAGALLAAFLLVPPVVRGVQDALAPPGREEIEPVLRHVATRWQAGDTLYLYYGAEPGFARYGIPAGLPHDVTPVVGVRSREDWLRYVDDVGRLAARERVWVVFSHVHGMADGREDRVILAALDRLGRRMEEKRAAGASAYLYDLRRTSSP